MQIHSEEIPSHPEPKQQLGMMSHRVKFLQRNAWTLSVIFITTCRHPNICWFFSDFLFLFMKGRERTSIFICLLLPGGLVTIGSFSTTPSLPEIRQMGKNPKILVNSLRHLWFVSLCLNTKTYAWTPPTNLLPPTAASDVLLWFS